MKQNHEFDQHIKNYRENLNKTLSLSGETSDFFARYKAQKLATWFAPFTNKTISILDFGCGDGIMTTYIKQEFPKATVHGIDPSSQSIERARILTPPITFQTLTNNKIPYAPETFDLVYAAGVFHHIPFAQHQKFVAQIMQVLKPGGHFVLFELNPYNPLTRLTFRRCPIDKNATMLSSRYAKNMLRSWGNIQTKHYCFFPAFLKWLRPTEKLLTKLPLGALYANIVKKELS